MKLKFVLLYLFILSPYLFSSEDLTNLIIPSVQPGIYNRDIELTFNDISGIDYYYRFESSLNKNKVKFSYPLDLSAMEGECREYNIIVSAFDNKKEIQTITITYVIDKDVPDLPTLNKFSGIYNSSVSLKFKNINEKIFYNLVSEGNPDFKLWDGNSIDIKQKDNLQNIILKYYSEDSAGNRSAVNISKYTILPAHNPPSDLNVLSPVEGIFLNSQLIYIDTKDFKWIRYSFNHVDPVLRGTSYIKPVLIKSPGTYKLNVAAQPLNSDTVLTKEINFEITDNKEIIIDKPSGVYSDDLNLRFNDTGFNFTTQDRPVVSWDLTLPESISFMPIPGTIKYQYLRISNLNSEGEFRYFYALDKRIPSAPIISINSKIPISKNSKIRILGENNSDIYYTLDGTTPDQYSNYYRRPFDLIIPENRSTGSLLIKAISYNSENIKSQISTKLITYDVTKPEKPNLSILDSSSTHVSFSIDNISNYKLVYNLSFDGSNPSKPNEYSFTGSENMTLKLPVGLEADINIAAALINNAGNISDVAYFHLLKSDTIPPEPPKISFNTDVIEISGKGKIWYQISDSDLIKNSPFLIYEKPLNIETDNKEFYKIFITAFTIDEYGNKSEKVKYNRVIVDNRIPQLPFYSGIVNGGLYNNPRRIKFHNTDDLDIFYSVATGNNFPEVPIHAEENKVTDSLFFDCPENEVRHYKINFNVFFKGTDNSSLNTVEFTIDRIKPEPPVINSVVNGGVYNKDIIFKKNISDDTLWILIENEINTENLSVDYFKTNGILLNRDYIFKQDDPVEKSYQLASLSLDNAGNSIFGDIINFTIDKLPPESPSITIENMQNEDMNIILSTSNDDTIFYEISFNGSYPDDPSILSAKYSDPIIVKNKTFNTIYVKAKTMDKAGNFSIDTTTKRIINYNIPVSSPIISIGQIDLSKYLISFPTQPGNDIYVKYDDKDFFLYTNPFMINLRDKSFLDIFFYTASKTGKKSSVAVHRLENKSSNGSLITGIINGKIYNTGRVVWKKNESRIIRYEVSLNGEKPSDVNVFSPEMVEPIVFDTGLGETINVTLRVREFINDIPVIEKDENIYNFVIDKKAPSKPKISGIFNNGIFNTDKKIVIESDFKIFYKLSTDSQGLNNIEFKEYSAPLNLKVLPGKYETYTLNTYTLDKAGNKSEIVTCNFSIDKANVFVSVNGRDSNDGTRENPFKTIERALEFGKESERKIINIAEGEYVLQQALDLNNFTLIGGYNIGNWKNNNGLTLLQLSSRGRQNYSLITVNNGKSTIKNIIMTNINTNSPIIKSLGGILEIDNIKIYHANKNVPTDILVENGSIKLSNSIITYGQIDSGNLISINNGSIDINNLAISGTGDSKSLNILKVNNSDLQISDSTFTTSNSDNIMFVNSLNSNISITNSIFNSGSASKRTDLFILEDSKLQLNYFKLIINSKSRILSVIDGDKSKINISNSNFNLESNSGISFARLTNSTFELNNSTIYTKTTNEFINLIKGNSSIVDLQNNKIVSKIVDIFNGISLNNTFFIMENNFLSFEGGVIDFIPFYFEDPLNLSINNNVIISNNKSWISSETSAAVIIDGGKDTISINGNNFLGWNQLIIHNGSIIKNVYELNNYRKFLDKPVNNYTKDVD